MSATGAARRLRVGLTALLLMSLTGCGLSFPSDPNGTLSVAAGAELRIGITAEPGLAEPGIAPSGPLPDLARAYAASINASPDWKVGGEETLVQELEDGSLDIAFGNFSEDSPWLDRAALSRPFTVKGAQSGELVALMPLGENALLANFESFIDANGIAR